MYFVTYKNSASRRLTDILQCGPLVCILRPLIYTMSENKTQFHLGQMQLNLQPFHSCKLK